MAVSPPSQGPHPSPKPWGGQAGVIGLLGKIFGYMDAWTSDRSSNWTGKSSAVLYNCPVLKDVQTDVQLPHPPTPRTLPSPHPWGGVGWVGYLDVRLDVRSEDRTLAQHIAQLTLMLIVSQHNPNHCMTPPRPKNNKRLWKTVDLAAVRIYVFIVDVFACPTARPSPFPQMVVDVVCLADKVAEGCFRKGFLFGIRCSKASNSETKTFAKTSFCDIMELDCWHKQKT